MVPALAGTLFLQDENVLMFDLLFRDAQEQLEDHWEATKTLRNDTGKEMRKPAVSRLDRMRYPWMIFTDSQIYTHILTWNMTHKGYGYMVKEMYIKDIKS